MKKSVYNYICSHPDASIHGLESNILVIKFGFVGMNDG